MRKIAVFIHSFSVEYTLDLLKGICDYFKGKDVKLIIAQTKHPHCDQLGEYQCWTSAELLFSKDIDAYIVIAGAYSGSISDKTLSSCMKRLENRPVVSISMNLKSDNCYHTKTECESTYYELVNHLVTVHGCRKIAFLRQILQNLQKLWKDSGHIKRLLLTADFLMMNHL